MGSCLRGIWLCLLLLCPLLAVGGPTEKDPASINETSSSAEEDGGFEILGDAVSSLILNRFREQVGFTNTEIGLTTQPLPVGSLCNPEKIVELSKPVLEQESKLTSSLESLHLCVRECSLLRCVWRYYGPVLQKSLQKAAAPNAVRSLPHPHDSNRLDDKDSQRSKRSRENEDVEVLGVSYEYESDKKRVEYDDQGSAHILEQMPVKIRMYGRFNSQTHFKLTKFSTCDDTNNPEPEVEVTVDASGTMGEVHVTMPKVGELYKVYLCLKTSSMPHFVRQGDSPDGRVTKPWLVIHLSRPLLPLWIHLALLILLLVLSGLFSGLNLGLMSLDKTDLKILINTGTTSEKHYASSIAPVRNHGNFLLCCLLFSNVLVNASLTILVDDLTSGLVAIIMSTLSIVIFGEIIPQAICSRHGLAAGAKTLYITKFFMFITSPLAYPLSKVLDCLLGEEIGAFYTRERLKELLFVTKDNHGLGAEEVDIIEGVLDMKTKTVKDVMVRVDHAYMLPINTVLDFDTMVDLEFHGYSRIPVFEGEKNNIVALLNIKQLTLLDGNDKIPLRTVVEYYRNNVFFVQEGTRLDFMLKVFREGSHGHMAFVQRVNVEGPGDPYYETIGLLTLEDVLEELLQAEIMDECDIGKKEARKGNGSPRTIAPLALLKRKPKTRINLPQPLALAALQFLTTSVEPFNKTILSSNILQRLVSTCAHFVKVHRQRGDYPNILLYQAGKPSEYFVIVLEGRVEVQVGNENLTYETGSFTTFGKDFLISALAADKDNGLVAADKLDAKHKRTFTPDYTVRVVTDLHYLMIKYSAYKAAILATGIERTNADPSQAHSKNWQEDLDRILERMASYDDDSTSESGRRISRLSRQESFRNITFGDGEVVQRKISFATIPAISEGPEGDGDRDPIPISPPHRDSAIKHFTIGESFEEPEEEKEQSLPTANGKDDEATKLLSQV